MEEGSCVSQLMSMLCCKGAVAGILSSYTSLNYVSLQFKLIGSLYLQRREDEVGRR